MSIRFIIMPSALLSFKHPCFSFQTDNLESCGNKEDGIAKEQNSNRSVEVCQDSSIGAEPTLFNTDLGFDERAGYVRKQVHQQAHHQHNERCAPCIYGIHQELLTFTLFHRSSQEPHTAESPPNIETHDVQPEEVGKKCEESDESAG